MLNRATVTGANKVFLFFTALYIAFQLVLGILTGIYGNKIITGTNLYIILLTNQFVIVLLPVVFYILRNKLSFKRVLRLNRLKLAPAIMIMIISIPAYFAAAMLNNLLVYFLQNYIEIPDIPVPVPGNALQLVISLLILAVSPAVCEELMHRGLFLNAFERRGTTRAIFITAVIFGIFHFEVTNLTGPIFLGVLIAYYVVRTNSIFAGMLAHFINNAFYVLIQYFYGGSIAERGELVITPAALGSIVVLGVSCFIFVLLLLKIFRRVTDKSYVKFPPISSVRGDVAAVFTHWPMILVLIVYILLLGIYFFTIYVNNIIR